MPEFFFGFYGEAKAEYEFLISVIERYLKKLVPHADFNSLILPKLEAENEIERQRKFAKEYAGLHFMIIHRDADAPSEDKTLSNLFIPEEECKEKNIVPIIPIKETEAWILVDYSAFKEVVGTKLTAKELDYPAQAHQVEAIIDPKELINKMLSLARPQKRRFDVDEIYEAMGEKVSLEQLEKVPAFQNFRKRIVPILIQLGFRELEQS